MKFSKIASDTYEKLQLGAGVFLTTFTPTTGTFEDSAIFGATDGGVSFSATPTFKDLADGIDNATLNLKELKRIDSWEVKMSGTLKTIDTTVAKSLLGAGTIATNKVTANAELASGDFVDLWWVGDYGEKGGYIAIHLINALSTGGFKIQSANKDKGSFAFEYTAHSSVANADTVPFELYISSTVGA